MIREISGTERKASRKRTEGIWPLLEAEVEKPPAQPVVVHSRVVYIGISNNGIYFFMLGGEFSGV